MTFYMHAQATDMTSGDILHSIADCLAPRLRTTESLVTYADQY